MTGLTGVTTGGGVGGVGTAALGAGVAVLTLGAVSGPGLPLVILPGGTRVKNCSCGGLVFWG